MILKQTPINGSQSSLGQGTKPFSAGNDLRWQAEGNAITVPETGFAGLTSRFGMTKPVIAAVNGVAMGGGFRNCVGR